MNTIEILENARMNISNIRMLGMRLLPLIEEQIDNAICILEKGYSAYADVDDLLTQYGDVQNIPAKEDQHARNKS
jgi:hypothetical protein